MRKTLGKTRQFDTRRLLQNFEKAVRAHAFKGQQEPEAHAMLELQYKTTRDALLRHVDEKVETKGDTVKAKIKLMQGNQVLFEGTLEGPDSVKVKTVADVAAKVGEEIGGSKAPEASETMDTQEVLFDVERAINSVTPYRCHIEVAE